MEAGRALRVERIGEKRRDSIWFARVARGILVFFENNDNATQIKSHIKRKPNGRGMQRIKAKIQGYRGNRVKFRGMKGIG